MANLFTMVVGYVVGVAFFITGMFQPDNLLFGVVGLLALIWAEITQLTGGKDGQ